MPVGLEAYTKIQGQVSDKPLVSGEQFGGGGIGTARGYLEGEAFGDNAIFGQMELRTPPLSAFFGKNASDWRIYAFAEGGRLVILQPLPQQQSVFDLADFGIGSRIQLRDHFNGSLDLGFPLISQAEADVYHPRLTFRLWVEF
jgi:hemolysin activation/secretion protein